MGKASAINYSRKEYRHQAGQVLYDNARLPLQYLLRQTCYLPLTLASRLLPSEHSQRLQHCIRVSTVRNHLRRSNVQYPLLPPVRFRRLLYQLRDAPWIHEDQLSRLETLSRQDWKVRQMRTDIRAPMIAKTHRLISKASLKPQVTTQTHREPIEDRRASSKDRMRLLQDTTPSYVPSAEIMSALRATLRGCGIYGQENHC